MRPVLVVVVGGVNASGDGDARGRTQLAPKSCLASASERCESPRDQKIAKAREGLGDPTDNAVVCVSASPSVRDFLHRGHGDHLGEGGKVVDVLRVTHTNTNNLQNSNFRVTKQWAQQASAAPGGDKPVIIQPLADRYMWHGLRCGGGGPVLTVDTVPYRTESPCLRHHHRPGCHPMSRDFLRGVDMAVCGAF